MNKNIEETKVKLQELYNSPTKEIRKIIESINYLDLEITISNLITCEKITNKELTIVFDILIVYYSKENITISLALQLANLRFGRFEKDVELVIMSYFKLLNMIRPQIKNEIYNAEIFNKIYDAIQKKITRTYILKSLYKYLANLMNDERFYLNLFIERKYYINFLFFNLFVNEFYEQFDDEQSIEIFLFTNETYQKELIKNFKSFNPYILLLDNENVSFPFLYLVYNNDILFKNLATERLATRKTLFLTELSTFVDKFDTQRTQNIQCKFSHLHNNFDAISQQKEKLKQALNLFNEKLQLTELQEFFRNPFWFLRYNENTDLVSLGNFIGKEKNKEYLIIFLSTFDFKNSTIIDSLREFLRTFILPGESQVIVRILEQFSIKLFNDKRNADNISINVEYSEKEKITDMIENMNIQSDQESRDQITIENDKNEPIEEDLNSVQDAIIENLVNEEALRYINNNHFLYEPDPSKYTQKDIYILIYSLIMLNTNIHNLNVKIKPNRKSFLENIKRCKISSAMSEIYLENLYYSIKKHPIQFIDKNQYSVNHYRIFKKVKEDIIDKNIKYININFEEDINDIETSICYDCKHSIYSHLFTSCSKEIFNFLTYSENNILKGDDIIKICKFFDSKEIKLDLCYFLFNNFDINYFDKFFDVYFELIEHCNSEKNNLSEKIKNTEHTNVYKLPFLMIQKIYDVERIDKGSFFKKEKTIKYDKQKLVNRFVRNTASVDELIFYHFVNENIKTEEKLILNIIHDIILKNCFRVKKILNTDIFSILLEDEMFLDELLQKIVELELKDDFISYINLLESLEYPIENFLLKIAKEKLDFVDEGILNFYKEKLRKESLIYFKILLFLQKKFKLFDFVCLPFVTIYDNHFNVEKLENEKLELFTSLFNQPKNLIDFYMLSKDVTNYRTIGKYIRNKENIEAKICPLKDETFLCDINKQLSYILIKDYIINDEEIHRYSMGTIQILAHSIPLFINYVFNNLFVIKILESYTLKSFMKIFIIVLKKITMGNQICHCKEGHNILEQINFILNFLVENKKISKEQIAFYLKYVEEKNCENQKEDDKTDKNEITDEKVFDL